MGLAVLVACGREHRRAGLGTAGELLGHVDRERSAGALDRGKQLAMVERLTAIVADAVADAVGDPGLASRTWVLLTEAPDGGSGLAGHANTNEELVAAARAQLASLAAGKQASD